MEAVEYKNIRFSGKTMMLYKLGLGEVVMIPFARMNWEEKAKAKPFERASRGRYVFKTRVSVSAPIAFMGGLSRQATVLVCFQIIAVIFALSRLARASNGA